MKPMTICLACCFLFLQNIKSQDSLKRGELVLHRAVQARISFSENQSMRVPIMAIRDSSIFVYEKTSAHKDPFRTTDIYDESNWDSYNYRYIESIKVINKPLRSWVMPVSIVTGVIAGLIIGRNSGSSKGDFESEINNVGTVFLGGVIGGAVGTLAGVAIISASEKKYMINGEWKSFEEMKKSMNY